MNTAGEWARSGVLVRNRVYLIELFSIHTQGEMSHLFRKEGQIVINFDPVALRGAAE
jgi:hypothetical protein